MRFLFRVDASIQIGTGHIMRCLTLANHLKSLRHECIFICRDHDGHLGNNIISAGHQLYLLKSYSALKHKKFSFDWNNHAKWLGVDWSLDVKESLEITKNLKPDWLIIDHYALDRSWEIAIRPSVKNIMVIDDLEDRDHDCDILLDQTFGRKKYIYEKKVPKNCKLLCGSKYSLLREEFKNWRNTSLLNREFAKLNNILINLGGIDKDNFTSLVLDGLKVSKLPETCTLTVIMGSNAPHVSYVKKIASEMPRKTEVKVGIEDMAELMAYADLAIGAGGSSAWERCCLGLPTIQLVIAENQNFIAESLDKAGAIKAINNINALPNLIETAPKWMSHISQKCRSVTDGEGVQRVVSNFEVGYV